MQEKWLFYVPLYYRAAAEVSSASCVHTSSEKNKDVSKSIRAGIADALSTNLSVRVSVCASASASLSVGVGAFLSKVLS